MPLQFSRSAAACRAALLSAGLALSALAAPLPGFASDQTVRLPTTPAGELGAELIRQINAHNPSDIQQWASGVLSASIPEVDAADFVANLASAARDSGGVDLFDARVSTRQPGILQMVVKGRRSGQLALLVLMADPDQPGRLAQAGIVPMDDPGLYADWPEAPVSLAEMGRLIRSAIDHLVKSNDFAGCVTVTDHSKTVFNECRGLADQRFSVPIDQETKFHIGSVGKMFTAVAIGQLVEAGKLSWDTTVDTLLPEYPDQAAAKNITVWQLLHHTSGLGDFMVPAYFAQREKFIDAVDYLDLIAKQPMVGEPGKEWSYSNSGYVLLGRIIENVSHQRYDDYIQQHVFAPANMQASGFDRLEEVTPKLAVGYYRDGIFANDWKTDWAKIQWKGGPAGGGYSNNTDLLRFANALRTGRLVKPATLAKMFDDPAPAGPGGYAAGFGDRLSHGSPIRGHSGGIEGTTANLQMVWNTNAAVALTSNQGPSQTWMLAEKIADLLAAQGAKSEAQVRPDPSTQLASDQ